MKWFKVETEGRVREVYWTEATDEAHARRLFEEGELTETSVSEVWDAEVVGVHEIDEEAER